MDGPWQGYYTSIGLDRPANCFVAIVGGHFSQEIMMQIITFSFTGWRLLPNEVLYIAPSGYTKR